jgi:hypothetical protein
VTEDTLYRKGVWVKLVGCYAVTAWAKIHNVPGSYVLHDIMAWRPTYKEAVEWRTGVGMRKLDSGEVGNSIVGLNERAGRMILIKKAPFFSLLGHVEWRDVIVP